MFRCVGLPLIPSTISGNAVNFDKLALIVGIIEDFCSYWNIFPSFVLAGVTLLLRTISRYVPVSSVSLVCSKEITLHCWNTNLLIVVAIDTFMSGVRLISNAKKLGSAILMRVIARCLFI